MWEEEQEGTLRGRQRRRERWRGGADVESDDEDIAHFLGIDTDSSGRKRAVSEDREEEPER